MNEKELFNLLRDISIISGGEFYVPISYAGNFVNECRNNNFAIIGIESFGFVGKKIIPDLERIADFSFPVDNKWNDYKNKCNDEAGNFIQRYRLLNDLYLSFTVLSESEWDKMRHKKVPGKRKPGRENRKPKPGTVR